MKSASLKFKRYASQTRISRDSNLQVRILHSMMFALGMLAVFYVLVLGNMVFNIAERKALEIQARNISNEVGEMELTYLTMINKVDLGLAHSLQFKEAKATFATRKASVGALQKSATALANNDL